MSMERSVMRTAPRNPIHIFVLSDNWNLSFISSAMPFIPKSHITILGKFITI
jgi:hypothetical protein